MPLNKQAVRRDKAAAKQRRSPTAKPDLNGLEQEGMGRAIQAAEANPGTLTSGDMLRMQRMIGNRAVNGLLAGTLRGQPVQRKVNATGLPDGLKAGVETLSGTSMDDVKVHYNSSEPGGLQAWAYTQGTDIHVGPGQEQFLPHEAWHVVQQKQGRVTPTSVVGKRTVNTDSRLESEADAMGRQALTLPGDYSAQTSPPVQRQSGDRPATSGAVSTGRVIQLGKKTHIAVGALLGTIVPVIGNIIGGYIGYRIYKKKKQQRDAAASSDTQATVAEPPTEVVGPMRTMSDDKLFEMEREVMTRHRYQRGRGQEGMELEAESLPPMDPVALKGFIERVKDLILGKQYKEAYDLLTSRDNARRLGINLITDRQVLLRFDETYAPRLIHRMSTANMSYPAERKITLQTAIIGVEDVKDISDYPTLAEAILPMYLEEYMHQYQGNTKSFFSETTSRFKSSYASSERGKGADYDEVDVMARMHEWGFNVEKIDYVKRYQEREDYWEWLKKERDLV